MVVRGVSPANIYHLHRSALARERLAMLSHQLGEQLPQTVLLSRDHHKWQMLLFMLCHSPIDASVAPTTLGNLEEFRTGSKVMGSDDKLACSSSLLAQPLALSMCKIHHGPTRWTCGR